MRKSIKLFMLFILFLPLMINATTKTYNNSKAKANNYIISFDNYKRYILIPSDSKFFAYEKDGYDSTNGSGFKNGGFISSHEYYLSLEHNSSWLAPGVGYWTLSKKDNNENYYISNAIYSKNINEKLASRITEYVQPSSKVKGDGTMSNPWYFVESYMIRLKSNNELYGNLGSGSNIGSQEFYVEEGTTKSIAYTATPGYNISTSNISNCSKKYFTVEDNKLIIKSLDRDLSCVINFEPQEYTITFNANGGTINAESKNVTYDSAYGELPTATRSGYTFLGWYTDPTSGSEVKDTTTVKITSNQTLYAHYRMNTVTVTYVLSNGQSNVTKTVNYGEKYNLPTNLTVPTCSTLTGWYDESGNQVTSDTIMTKASDHTITARWNNTLVTPTYSNVKNYLSYTGGWEVKSDSGGWYIRFTSSGTLTVKACMNVDLSLIGGGGGGGGGRNDNTNCQAGAGGSAGYTQNYNNITLNSGSYAITIGAGGSGGGYASRGGNGGTTKFGSYTAAGGGGSNTGTAGSSGGSGGGASGNTSTYVTGGSGGSNGSNGETTGNGGGGGQGRTTYGFGEKSYELFSGGGGGGALRDDIICGPQFYKYCAQSGGSGGAGGGANGGGKGVTNGYSASANTGGGGGGGSCWSGSGGSGGRGGSGIALMRNKR